MKTKLLVLTVAAIAVTSVAFIACNDSDNEITPDPAPSANRSVTGYEDAFEITYSDHSVLTLSQNTTDASVYRAHYKGADYGVKYSEAGETLTMYDGQTLVFQHKMPGAEAPNGGYPGDCDKLGARKQGESYKDCYSRNFNNFCCDFLSCAAFAVQPIAIMTAIGAACLTTEGQLDINKLKNLRTGEVIFDRTNQN